MHKTGPKGTYERCTYRWTHKECPNCQEANDISARYCWNCKTEIVNPNEKLRAEFKRIKKDPTQVQTDEVVSINLSGGVSQAGNRTVRADFVTPWRSFSIWFTPESRGWKQQQEWAMFCKETARSRGEISVVCSQPSIVPKTVTYCKDPKSGFYRLLGLNKEPDREPEEPSVSSFWEQAV